MSVHLVSVLGQERTAEVVVAIVTKMIRGTASTEDTVADPIHLRNRLLGNEAEDTGETIAEKEEEETGTETTTERNAAEETTENHLSHLEARRFPLTKIKLNQSNRSSSNKRMEKVKNDS